MNSNDNFANFLRKMMSGFESHKKDEAKNLLKEIELERKNVANSKTYAGMRLVLEQKRTFQLHLKRVLGSYSNVEVVIYCLGSIEFSYHSMFQLAVMVQLKLDFPKWIGNVKVYDPLLTPADVIVLKELGFEVLTINENCKSRVQRPTMFFMPNPNIDLIGNLLGSNWSSSCINQIFLLTNSFRVLLSDNSLENYRETRKRLRKIRDFKTEIDIKTSDEQMYAHVFSGFAWHFFKVDPNMDMGVPLPVTESGDEEGCYWLDKQRYLGQQRSREKWFLEAMESDLTSKAHAEFFQLRGPCRLRCNSFPPHRGWIKLNIYGTEGDQPGRYSGVLQDEKGIPFGKYSGDSDVEDSVIAGLEALRCGLIKCMEERPNSQKLIVESDNVILVQYVNGCPEPNEETMSKLNVIFNLLERITCVVYHVYEDQANSPKESDVGEPNKKLEDYASTSLNDDS